MLAKLGDFAELYCFSDPNSSILKSGMINESIVNLVFTYDSIPLPYENTAVNRINTLSREGMITRDICDIMHALRKSRNDASHENYDDPAKAKVLLEMAYSLCEWFMQTYGDWSYESRPFVMPVEGQHVSVSEEQKAQQEQEEKDLQTKAEKAAAAAPSVDKKKRQKQSQKASSHRYKSEEETRYLIDEQLRQVGWEADTQTLRYGKGTRPEKDRNIAIAEWPTDSTVGNSGRADYALFVGEKMVATVEAKAMHKDIPSVIDYQCKEYSKLIKAEHSQYQISTWGDYKVPFTFATNGRPYLEQLDTKSGIWFLDLRENYNAPKALRGWISPAGMMEMLEKDIEAGNRQLLALPYDDLRDKEGLNLRDYQIKAIQAAEKAIMDGQQYVLLAMATGTGKTRTVLGMIYRFLKTDRFKRILFLVDRTSLGDQAEETFDEVKLEDLKTLDNIYTITGLNDEGVEDTTRVHIATVQSMVKRLLYNSEDQKPAVTDYDLVIIDEAHRGYILDKEMGEEEILFRDQMDYQSKYRSVIEYFDAVRIALTATPALQTTEIFGKPVFSYTYREAVIDGYLVDHDVPHDLHTHLRDDGIHYKKGDTVVLYDPVTGEIMNSELLEDELDFDIKSFNRQIAVESFNRAVLEEIAMDLDPENPDIHGKTLIYAVDDAHADMIVKILKDIYSEYQIDNDAIMKITGSVGGGNPKKVKEAIKQFKNENFPSVVVTVDLLTTGIDVPEITTLVFLRRVSSRILFEQMLGRATRLCPKIHKTHFEIYDPVGTYESLQPVNTMKPVVANPSATFEQLLDELDQAHDEKDQAYHINQIIAKLQRKNKRISDQTLEKFKNKTGGKTPSDIIVELHQYDPEEAKKRLLAYADAFKLLQEKYANGSRPVVISQEEDYVTSHERGYGKSSKPEDYLNEFQTFVQTNMNEIAALNIVCTRPKELTRESLKSLRLTLDDHGFTTQQLNTAISELTNEEIAADIISLIRCYAIGSTLISHEARIRRAVDRLKKAHSFSKQELSWIARMEQYLMKESVLNVDVFDEDSRFRSKGGFLKIDKVFGNKLTSIVQELNEYLYDDGGRVA